MAGFKLHSAVGVAAALLAATLLGHYQGIAPPVLALTAIAVYVGSIYPDTDLATSTSRQVLGTSVFAAGFLGLIVFTPRTLELTAVAGLLAGYSVLALLVGYVYDALTDHRDLLHNPLVYLAGFGVAGIVYLVFPFQLGYLTAVAAAGFNAGALSHILVDYLTTGYSYNHHPRIPWL